MIKNLHQFLKEQTKADNFSGAVLVAKNGQPIFEYSFGFAIKEKQIPNKIDTKFNIGSMNKMFTGVAIAKLVEEKKLNFQDLIGKYLKKYPKKVAGKVTIHHILTHTEGFPSYFNKKYIVSRSKLKTINDYLELFKDESLLFEPGEKYQYSNSGYIVLGAIIEAITKQTYENYVKENIFKIANMGDTGLFELDDPSLANGYTFRKPYSHEVSKTRRNNMEELPQKGNPAGGGYSTCLDLLKFAQALLGNKLLSPEMTKLVLTPKEKVGTKEGQTLYYGYGFQILDVGDGHLRFGHAGGFAGVNGRLDMYPWRNLIVVVLSNYDEPAAFRIANEATRLVIS